jgi:hypothetical protein
MPTYRFVWPTGYTAHMTVPQYEQACRIAQRYGMTHTVTVQPVFGLQDAVLLDVGSMVIGVLADGSSHT